MSNKATIATIKVMDKSFFGRLISLFTLSKYSHAALLHLEKNEIYEMQFEGQRRIYIKGYPWDFKIEDQIEMTEEEFYNRVNQYKDTKYDWFAVIFFPLNRLLGTKIGKSSKRLMCVEYIGKILGYEKMYSYKTMPKEI